MRRTAWLVLSGVVLCACSEDPSRTPGDSSVDLDTGALDHSSPGQEKAVGDLTDLELVDTGTTDVIADLTAKPDTPPPPATELLLFDGDNRQFTAAEKGFHPLIKPGDPIPASNWLTPVDFYTGQLQMRYIIKSPANQVGGKLQTCIWTMGNADGDGKDYFPESCSSYVSHTGVGTYTLANKLDPASWWKHSGVPLDFTHPERFLIRVVLRGPSGCNVTTHPVTGACWDEWLNYQNMTFRITIVMVGKGKTFSGWNSYP